MTKHNYPPADSFHWRDDIFFRVEPDGAVRCWKFGKQHFFTIPPSEWQSVVKWIALQQRSAPIAEDALVERVIEAASVIVSNEFSLIDDTEPFENAIAEIRAALQAIHEKKG